MPENKGKIRETLRRLRKGWGGGLEGSSKLDKRIGGDIILVEPSAPKLCLLESIGYPLMLSNERKSWLRNFFGL